MTLRAKFCGQECYGLGEILHKRHRVKIRIAETQTRNRIVATTGSFGTGNVRRAVRGQIGVRKGIKEARTLMEINHETMRMNGNRRNLPGV